MTCQSCIHWQKHYDSIPPRTGDCRANPPTIVNAVVTAHMATSTSISEAIELASRWPTTKAQDGCGQFEGAMPC